LFGEIKQARQAISEILFWIDAIFDIVEKLQKLCTWEEQNASQWALLLMLLAFFVVTFIPLRGIICVWLFDKF